MRIAVFDVETDRLLQKGGTGHETLEITVACGASMELTHSLHSIHDDARVRTFYGDVGDASDLGGETMEDLGRMLDGADVVVAYNGRSFDMRVLRNHFERDRVDRWEKKLVDPFEAMKDHTGSWVKLDELLEANGLPRKSADGVSAVVWWSEGRKREVADYCQDDVSGLIALLRLGKFAFPVKRWRRTEMLKMRQEIESWSELNWSAYLDLKVAERSVSNRVGSEVSPV